MEWKTTQKTSYVKMLSHCSPTLNKSFNASWNSDGLVLEVGCEVDGTPGNQSVVCGLVWQDVGLKKWSVAWCKNQRRTELSMIPEFLVDDEDFDDCDDAVVNTTEHGTCLQNSQNRLLQHRRKSSFPAIASTHCIWDILIFTPGS